MRNACFAAIAVGIAMLLSPLALAPVPALAQTQMVVIDCLPPWKINDRFGEMTLIKHPSLSLNGFDCGTNCNIGYGLKQILEGVYGNKDKQDTEIKDVFGKMVNLATKSLESGQIDENSVILQSRGFIALASYVLENNDYDPAKLMPSLPSAKIAVNNFRTALLQYNMWKMNKTITDDGVKWTASVTNVARAIDFYLALENAYEHYDTREYSTFGSRQLLDIGDKFRIMDKYLDLILNLEERSTLFKFAGIKLLTRYHAEPGNASLKMQVSIAYALLTYQKRRIIGDHIVIDENEDKSNISQGYISRSFLAAGIELTAGIESSNNRRKYWRYQSAIGKFFWAEGPYYFHITLSDIIPFWHTARINGLLRDTSLHSFRFLNPFHQPWFLNPLHWLADVSTPDGKTPPIDDGNKQYIYNAGLLHWSSEYGDNLISKKFARIVGAIKSVKGSSLQKSMYPVAIAIPRRPISNSGLPDGIIGNQYSNRKSGAHGRQEIILRRTINNKQHYILFNGESGDAIIREEGHEQGDQMQLLYYVDDISYLSDSGYDSPETKKGKVYWRGGSWSNYYDHNVMIMESDSSDYVNGGIISPRLSTVKRRIVSQHQNINNIYAQSHNKIDVLSGQVKLELRKHSGKIMNANYYRNILFINDNKYPYIVDINAITNNNSAPAVFKMYYHGNSNNTSILPSFSKFEALRWNNIHESNDTLSPLGTNNNLLIQPFSIENSPYLYEKKDIIRESYLKKDRGLGVSIAKMELHNVHHDSTDHNNNNHKRYFTTVAFIHALINGQKNLNLAQKGMFLPTPENGTWKYFTWIPENGTIDVILSRSSQHYSSIKHPNSKFPLTYIYFPIIEADSFYVELDSNKNYGFVRLIKKNGVWNIDKNFQLNIKKSKPIVTISGPTCIKAKDNIPLGHFTSYISKGKPPYSYAWSSYINCPVGGSNCGNWNNIGNTRSIDYGGYNGQDFKLRLQVFDNSSPREVVTSNEMKVRILGPREGSCSSNINNSIDAQEEYQFLLNADLLESTKSIPESFALHQNYPNPFNPSTEIDFDLPEPTMVFLVVYDVLGREVARLVEKELSAGWHRARFDAGNLPSGVYLYRIQAGNFHDTGRMLLLK